MLMFGDEEEPVLHEAAGCGDTSVIRRCIRRHGETLDVDRKWDCETALHVACRRGHVQCALILLEAGADYNLLTDYRYESTLFLASKFGHLGIVELITSCPNFDIHSKCCLTGLRSACSYGWPAIVDHYMGLGVDPHVCLPNGQTPLTQSSIRGHYHVAETLLRSWDCSVNHLDSKGNCALILALKLRRRRAVSVLLRYGAAPNVYNANYEMYPLHTAVYNDDLECIEMLLGAGAQTNVRNGAGQTPLYMASELGLIPTMKTLISAGASPDIMTDETMNTCIFAALDMNLQSVYLGGGDPLSTCRTLIQAGCNLSHENRVGSTALQVALDKQLCEVAVMLLHADCSLRAACCFTMDNDCYIVAHDNDCDQLYDLYIHKTKNPAALLSLCRSVFTRCLTYKLPYKRNVFKLPLPSILQQYLLFNDIG